MTVYQSHVTLESSHVPSSDSNNQGSCDTISDADCALKDVLDCVKKDLRDKHAVILLNAPTASYADVMVLRTQPLVNLVCVGTGVEGTDMAPGSEPSHYVLHRITTGDLWQRWTEEDGKDGELRKLMAESGAWSMLATAMVENARAAALFKDHVHRNLHLCTTRSSCLAYLQSAVLDTAFEYKSKNGANTITSASAILEALQYPFHRLTSLAPEHLLLARQYGVLTDLATFQSHSDDGYKPVKFVVGGAVRYLRKLETECPSKTDYVEKPTGLVLSIPAKAWSRYEMSAAQLALCRIGYGVSPRAPTCDGFEGTVVDFVLFALLAGPPPPESRLLYDINSDRHPAFVLLDQLYKGEAVRPADCVPIAREDRSKTRTVLRQQQPRQLRQHF